MHQGETRRFKKGYRPEIRKIKEAIFVNTKASARSSGTRKESLDYMEKSSLKLTNAYQPITSASQY